MANTKTIAELLETRARQTPDEVFGVHAAGEITFRDLECRVNRLANGLAKRGVAAGQRVAVLLTNHPDHIFTFFALARLGAVWVPVNTNLRGAGLEFIFRQAAPRTVIMDAQFWPHIKSMPSVDEFDTLIIRNPGAQAESADGIDFAAVAEGGGASR